VKNSRIREWQQRFREQPRVWLTYYKDGEWTGSIYESKQAAEHEVAFELRRGGRIAIAAVPIHSLELSAERWTLDTPPEAK
jgi:hypothetical protein